MQVDAVDHYHWITWARLGDAVALGQVAPGPVVHTVTIISYAAAGLPGALLAAAVAFSPGVSSSCFLRRRRWNHLRSDVRVSQPTWTVPGRPR